MFVLAYTGNAFSASNKYTMLLTEFLCESLSDQAEIYRALPFQSFAKDNRRFIYDPVSRRMLIGGMLPNTRYLTGSHAEDWYDVTGSNKFFDRCVRGWVGMGGRDYKHGIIHMAPHVDPAVALPAIQYFVKNGATSKCKVRSIIGFPETTLAVVYPELFKKLDV